MGVRGRAPHWPGLLVPVGLLPERGGANLLDAPLLLAREAGARRQRNGPRRAALAYLETVEAYLAEQGSRERASARLKVHRNTVRQRADRIRQISGIDLEDRENRFELQVAVGIVRFRELQRQGTADDQR